VRKALRRTSVPRDPLKEPIEEQQPDVALSEIRNDRPRGSAGSVRG
jgi:hypothetical protein